MRSKYETLHVAIDDQGVALLTLDRPEVLNAMSRGLIDDLLTALDDIDKNTTACVLLITGAGDRAFSVGGDISEMGASSPLEEELFTSRVIQCCWALANYRLPTIGAINGFAYGGGALLASALDIRIGCERTKFKFMGVQYGRVNGTWTLPMIVGWAHAKELLFSARLVAADEAVRINLLNHQVPAQNLMETAMSLARQIASNPPNMVQGVKQIMNNGVGESWGSMLGMEREAVRTRLRPGPAQDSFAQFLKRRGS
jgi:enoyl-CoA hydratase/carnithine racemase